MDYSDDFLFDYAAICIKEKYGVVVTFSKKKRAYCDTASFSPEQRAKAIGFAEGFFHGLSFR